MTRHSRESEVNLPSSEALSIGKLVLNGAEIPVLCLGLHVFLEKLAGQ